MQSSDLEWTTDKMYVTLTIFMNNSKENAYIHMVMGLMAFQDHDLQGQMDHHLNIYFFFFFKFVMIELV